MKTFLRHRLLHAGLLAVASLARAQAPAGPIDLPTALRLAGADNIEVGIAREKVAEAKASGDAAKARYFPWITPAIVWRRHDANIQAVNGPVIDADKQSFAAGVALNAQVDLGEARFQELAARQQVKAAEAALAGRQREAVLRAAVAYFELARTRSAVAVAEESARIAGRHAEEISATTSAGLTFKGDASRVQAAAERANLAVFRARAEQRMAAARLAEILRLDPAIELVPADAELAPVTVVEAGESSGPLVARALAARPELDEAAGRLEAARTLRRGSEVAPLVPTVGAQASFGGLGGGPSGSGVTRDWGYSGDYAIGLSWRVGPGGLFDSNRQREAAARERQVSLEQERVRELIRRQVVEQHVRARSLATQVELARKALEAADQTARLSRQRRDTGVSAVLEDLQAEEELARARRDYLSIVAEHNQAQYALKHAVGG
ncbi:MAG: TolC family protein [Opitutaceae bacterium]|jgi:outer membrane protein TolC|nr:TolC family protein [Opitutaceae bacterium]